MTSAKTFNNDGKQFKFHSNRWSLDRTSLVPSSGLGSSATAGDIDRNRALTPLAERFTLADAMRLQADSGLLIWRVDLNP